jgi:uncharacterized OB-fold protein
VSSILDQLRSGAGKAAFEADKLRKITTLRSEIRSLNDNVEEALMHVGQVAFQLHRSEAITQPRLREACARIDALQAQITAREREIERVQSETYQEPRSGIQFGHVCPNGHGQLPEGARFCPTCGAEGIHVPPPRAGAQCLACGAALDPGARFCPSCGTPVQEASAAAGSRTCPACGTVLVEEARFCPECGIEVPKPAPREAAPEPETPEETSPPPAESTAVICLECGTEMVPEARFCPECGAAAPEAGPVVESESRDQTPVEESQPSEQVTPDAKSCPECGAALVPEAIFCPDCGHRLEETPLAGSGADAQEEEPQTGDPEPLTTEADESTDEWQI